MNTSFKTVHGTTRLAFDSVEAVTNIVERMHETIARHPLPWSPQPTEPTRAHGVIASGVYSVIRGINSGLREGVDRSFGLLPEGVDGLEASSSAELKMRAALNGAFGDHLEATGNSLATPMVFMTPEEPLTLNREALAESLPQASPHLVIMVHGLSLSELNWGIGGEPSLGDRLQDELGFSALYLRYNSGRHISTNGQDFARQLDELCEAWPVPVESLSLIGHSMGGLVIRSACWYAGQQHSAWLPQLQRVVCLGTPHHGSAVAKAGHALGVLMEKTPYVEPLAIGRARSAGIKDLRYGNLLDEDWQGYHPDQSRPDSRTVVPLLPAVDYYFAAATLGRDRNDPLGFLLGDLLVRLDSAVGSHDDDLHKLSIKPENCQVFHEKNHFNLLVDEDVHRQIIDWFSA